ncbi:hypothetical protein [Hyphomicrobium sp. ghe19]|uniref:hypothetical protein n=1 Tax=Hyphomicrobium sp. ghe19 TaxID=2682968 RepID=UPI0013668CFF|nr:hypothetical protein HYPP_03793 [Hyphomicrobium sp. ghe19]
MSKAYADIVAATAGLRVALKAAGMSDGIVVELSANDAEKLEGIVPEAHIGRSTAWGRYCDIAGATYKLED